MCLSIFLITLISVSIALLKLSEETDLDILNGAMESLVETYQTELLPVAAELTARLVSSILSHHSHSFMKPVS